MLPDTHVTVEGLESTKQTTVFAVRLVVQPVSVES
jgi:hypothetical protein